MLDVALHLIRAVIPVGLTAGKCEMILRVADAFSRPTLLSVH